MKYLAEITKASRENDLHKTCNTLTDATIYISSNADADDGYRIISYEEKEGSLREGSKATLRCYCENDDTETTYDTFAEAETAIGNLAASDGYLLIDLEQPVGSAPSLPIDYKPSLWQRHHEEYAASQANNHSRTDTDRY